MAELDVNLPEGNPKVMGTDLERYYNVMRTHDLTEFEIREGSLYVKLSRAVAQAPVPLMVSHPVPVAKVPVVEKKSYHPVTSP
jgi:hypothetical protein